MKMIAAFGVWIFYGAILQGRHLGRLAPKRIATLCILAFSAAVSVLWAINFVSQRTS
jgi:predicted MFS family arabinose efflux permease